MYKYKHKPEVDKEFNHTDLYFESDLHLGHDKDFIYGPRCKDCVLTHDKDIEDDINEIVPKGATFFLLGDTIFGQDSARRLEEFLKRITPSEIYLLPGNHTSGYKQLRSRYGNHFDLRGDDGHDKEIRLVSNRYEISVCSQLIVLNHYPEMSWNWLGKGSWMIHGHVHGRIKTSLPNESGFGKMLDVGIESVKKPVSFKEIELIMSKKPIFSIDHHG